MFGVVRSPRNVVFGNGQSRAAPRYAAQLGKKLLIVTDERLAEAEVVRTIAEGVSALGLKVAVYSGVEPELPVECLERGLDAGRRLGADVIIGVGGGSCIDAAKTIALLLTHGGALSDYYGEFKVPGPTIPVIAIPTTSGTGSEVTPVAVVADKSRALKVGIASPFLIPDTAICDPELTYTCPRGLTAVSGADALVHAIEAFTTARREPTAQTVHEHVFLGKNDMSDLTALTAIRHIGSSLELACSEPDNETARSRMMWGALTAGQAFGVAGTSVCHAAQYPIGAKTGTPHGLGVAAMLPFALEFNRHHAAREIAQVGEAMGAIEFSADTQADIDATIAHIETLLSAIGIPGSIREVGLKETDLDWTARHAMSATRLIKNNPRPLDEASMHELIVAAFHGDRSLIRHEHAEQLSS